MKASCHFAKIRIVFLVFVFVGLAVGCMQDAAPDQSEASVIATRAYENENEVAIFIGENNEIGVGNPIIYYKDGSVDMGDGQAKPLMTPMEVERLYSDLTRYVRNLKSAHQKNLVTAKSCPYCSEFAFYDYAFEEFVILRVSNEMGLSDLATPQNHVQIPLSATYTQNRIKEYVATLPDEPQPSELVIDVEIYSGGTIDNRFDFSIYSDGNVIFADGRTIEIETAQVELLKDALNGEVYRDHVNSRNGRYDLLYDDTVDCSDCFKITLASYGEEPYITFQGDMGVGEVGDKESSILYELDHLYRYFISENLVEEE